MENIKNEIETKVGDLFKKQENIKCHGKDVTLVKLLEVTMQRHTDGNETDDFLINFKGQTTDAYGGISENHYQCTVNAKINVNVDIESINIISTTKN